MTRFAVFLMTVVTIAAAGWTLAGFADETGKKPVLLAYSAAMAVNEQPENFTPMPFSVPTNECVKTGIYKVAAGGEACGCKANQACCDAHDRCCPATHPHHCSSGNCYATAAGAQADCGNDYEICGVPQ